MGDFDLTAARAAEARVLRHIDFLRSEAARIQAERDQAQRDLREAMLARIALETAVA